MATLAARSATRTRAGEDGGGAKPAVGRHARGPAHAFRQLMLSRYRRGDIAVPERRHSQSLCRMSRRVQRKFKDSQEPVFEVVSPTREEQGASTIVL